MKHLQDFLKLIGIEQNVIKTLTSEDVPEDFDLNKIAETYKDNQLQVVEAKHRKKWEAEAVEKAMKGRDDESTRKAIENSLKTKLKREFALEYSNSDLRDKDIAEVVKICQESVAKQTDRSAEDWKKKLQELSDKYDKALQEKTTYKEQVEAKEKEFEKFKVEYDTRQKAKNRVRSKLATIPWTDPSLADRYQRIIERDIYDQFEVNADGTFVDKQTSQKVIKPDESRAYETIDEYIDEQVDAMKWRKVTHGSDETPNGKFAREVNIKGEKKVIDYSKIKEKAAKMGISEKEAAKLLQ